MMYPLITRRIPTVVAAVILSLSSGASLLCSQPSLAEPQISSTLPSQTVDPQILHVLNRLSFGARPGDVKEIQALGIEAYIQQQLHPENLPEPLSLTRQLAQRTTLQQSPLELFDQIRAVGDRRQQSPDSKQRYRAVLQQAMQEAMEGRFLRAMNSPRQLQEVMVNFWYNHFNVFAGKGIDRLLVGTYEAQAIRPYVLGRFRDLLGATAHHPAMLFYLDNWQNSAPHNPSVKGRTSGLNENYARELMELHTLGVDGGYTQQDVIALAKILTGWTFRRVTQPGVAPNGFYFDPKHHDFSNKVFLGRTIQGRGIAEGEEALDILAKSPATARHISLKLTEYFVADQPPASLVNRLSQRFLATDGNIREVLTTLFKSPEFLSRQAWGTKFKTPYEFTISALRATGAEEVQGRSLNAVLQQLGMPLYGCQTPDGYKNTTVAWLNSDALTRRLSFATALAKGQFPNRLATPMGSPPASLPLNAAQLTEILGKPISQQTQDAIASSPPQLQAALLLGSPEFMHR